jgi:hypothetical protein
MIGITCFVFFAVSAKAQLSDTTQIKSKAEIKAKHSPKRAALYSAIVPGLGQAYNKKYWKIPVIYVGFGALAYSFNYNQSRFVKYRTAYKYRIDGDSNTVDNFVGVYSDDNLNTLQKYYHRYRDLTVIGVAVLYVLNVVDASVDAHLFSFDVSDNLSMNIQPAIINGTASAAVTGLSLKIKF